MKGDGDVGRTKGGKKTGMNRNRETDRLDR